MDAYERKQRERRIAYKAVHVYRRVMALKITSVHAFARRIGNEVTSGVDWRGCSKSHIAESWALGEHGLSEAALERLEVEFGTRFRPIDLPRDHPLRSKDKR